MKYFIEIPHSNGIVLGCSVIVSAESGVFVTLATGIRHNVEVVAHARIRVLQFLALARHDYVEYVRRQVPLGYSTQSILINGQVILCIVVGVSEP